VGKPFCIGRKDLANGNIDITEIYNRFYYLCFMKRLTVRRSRLRGAGKGLFTNVIISNGTRIAEYKGKIITWAEVRTDDQYIYYVKRDHVIDARTSRAFAKYANVARGSVRVKGLHNNAQYVEVGKRVFTEGIKDIPARSEILVAYGKNTGMRSGITGNKTNKYQRLFIAVI
jgi:hypothetical protein